MANAPEGPVVKCPSCGAPVCWAPASAFRPFCSGRCRDQDWLAWATESYRVVGDGAAPDDCGERG
ncbi:MAG: DNA gyrase inhibitor YacG [Zoogloeaceae bacterium]|nr:DNA gyrase inhibitor YacG [Zoogloeaceae bacterium]